MPKDKSSFSSKFSNWIKQLKESERKYFKTSGDEKVFCNICCVSFKCEKKQRLDQHISTDKHRKSTERNQNYLQTQVTDQSRSDGFASDLCRALIAADIPVRKLENPIFKSFLEKYTNHTVPSRRWIQTRHFQDSYGEAISNIRKELQDYKIWMGVDETTDKRGRFVANVVVGALNGSEAKPHLLMSRELPTADNVTVGHLISDALHFLWPETSTDQISKKFVLLLSDAAPYMLKAGRNLKNIYPNLLHVTCLAHALHRVAETIRANYKNVDKLVASIKAVFKKSIVRIRKYHEILPGIPLPPEPVLTRWGTWLEAVSFLCQNFDGIKSVIDSFSSSDAECVSKAKTVISDKNVQDEIAAITSNFGFLADCITRLETRNLPLQEAFKILEEAKQKLGNVTSDIGLKVSSKLLNVLQKNPDLDKLSCAASVLGGNCDPAGSRLDPSLIVSLKFCPVTSVEVERSFSMAKNILSDRRQSFDMKNLEMYMICHYELCISGMKEETAFT